MTADQAILCGIVVLVFVFLVWGRVRYDVVAFAALVVAFLAGVVPKNEVFAGFGHPAVVIVALVLVISSGLSRSGAIEMLAKRVVDPSRGVTAHVGVMSGVAAALSALMNNVAALALLMPMDIRAARRAKRSPAITLMPLSFASILGGMITLIGTPPNIVIATFREDALGAPYAMFDFAPVGGAVALAGVLFVVFFGWRLIPVERRRHDSALELGELGGYVSEARVQAASPAIGKTLAELEPLAEENEVALLGLVRRGRRIPGSARSEVIRRNDLLVVEGGPGEIDELAGLLELEPAGSERHADGASSDVGMVEVVVPAGSRIVGRSAMDVRLLYRRGVTLLGISRRGQRIRQRVRKAPIRAGDLLLLMGEESRLAEAVEWLGALPLAPRGLQITRRNHAWAAVAGFAAAILAASLGLVYLPLALAAVVVLYVVLGIVPLSRLYDAVEWPVIVLLGSMIPLGVALETSGATALAARAIVGWTAGLPAVAVLAILMVVTMTLSDVLNNVATALIAAPIAIDVAQRLDANPDAFLMAVAVASSCAFLTPIGHKNNTIILGPGGYAFGDYWRMGLPLEILVLLVGVPMIVWVWPL